MPSFDAIVIGGGTNGLAAAGRLAKRRPQRAAAGGRRECRRRRADRRVRARLPRQRRRPPAEPARPACRGGPRARPPRPRLLGGQPRHHRALGDRRPPACSTAPTARRLGASSDSAAWATLRAAAAALRRRAAAVQGLAPPRLARGAGNETAKLAMLGLKLRAMGRDDLREFLRLLLINVADVLDDELTDDRLKGVLAFDAVLGAWTGAALAELADAAPQPPRRRGRRPPLRPRAAEGRHGRRRRRDGEGRRRAGRRPSAPAPASPRSRSRTTRSTGVRLDDGETDPRPHHRLGDQPAHHLPRPRSAPATSTPASSAASRNIRMRGTAAKLHLALTGAPDFRGADLRTRLVIAPSARAVEDAFNPVKYGAFSDAPVMEIVLPSAFEDGLAPAGHHVLSAIVQFAPSRPQGGWDARRGAFLDTILATLEAHAPGIGALVDRGRTRHPRRPRSPLRLGRRQLAPRRARRRAHAVPAPDDRRRAVRRARSPASGSPAPAAIPAAASPAPPAGTPPGASSRRCTAHDADPLPRRPPALAPARSCRRRSTPAPPRRTASTPGVPGAATPPRSPTRTRRWNTRRSATRPRSTTCRRW